MNTTFCLILQGTIELYVVIGEHNFLFYKNSILIVTDEFPLRPLRLCERLFLMPLTASERLVFSNPRLSERSECSLG